jgi:hypothetical protein
MNQDNTIISNIEIDDRAIHASAFAPRPDRIHPRLQKVISFIEILLFT